MLRPGSVRKAQIPVFPEIVLCEKHREKVNALCSNCNDLVCAECILDKHNGHSFKRIKEIVSEKRQELTTKLNNLDTVELPQIKKLLEETRLKKAQKETNNKELTDSINNRADKLVSGVNKTRNKFLVEVNRLYKQDNAKLTKLENKLEAILTEKEEIITEYRKDVNSPNDVKVVKITLELDKQAAIKPDELSTDVQSVKQHVFIPGNTDSLDDFGRCIEQGEDTGDVTVTKQSASSDHVIETKLEVVSEFQHETDKGSICALTTDNNNSAWIATYDGREVKRVDSDGCCKQTITFTTDINDLVITDDGCLLVTPNGGSGDHKYKIKKVKRNGEIVTFFDTKPLEPSRICTSPTGHLYVGCIDGGNFDVTDKNTRSVIKLSRDGVKLKTWQFDERHKRMFTLPSKLQTNNKDMIWVRDRTANTKGRVVVLHDQEDGVRFIYNGIKNDKITYDFNPCDLTTAADGTTMLIGDINNHIIHGVDENGSLLYYIGSQCQSGLGAISAICLNRKGNTLWTGDLKGHVQVLKLN